MFLPSLGARTSCAAVSTNISRLILLAVVALSGCADNLPTEPLPRDPAVRFGAFPGANGKIVFVSNRDPGGGILTTELPGFTVETLRPTGAHPAWSPDGSRIAFIDDDGNDTEVFVMDADGTNVTQLTNTPQFEQGPSWSADGTTIAFYSDATGTGSYQIYTIDANTGGTPTQLTSVGSNGTPSYSPDGTKIAFSSERAGNRDIYVMDVDGNNQTRLTTDAAFDFDPGWSPDGSKIVFVRQGANPGDLTDVYVMSADGTSPTNLTNSASSSDYLPAWSPDGSRIVFVTDRDGNDELYLAWADGAGVAQNLSFNGATDYQPDWQPLVSEPVCVFGPTVYTRQQGPPARYVENFTATPGTYSVDLDDLGSAGADAVVSLNGVVIMEGRGTTGEVGPRHHTVTVTLLANNVLEIHLRGKKGSVLQVTICTTAPSQCYPDLPAPELSLQSTTVNGTMVEFQLDVPNYGQFPDALFEPAPDLAPCGLNDSASRTWVDIRDGNGNYLYGFCALYEASNLNNIWFATPVDQWPAEAYITLTDRRCGITYTSNRINLASIF